MYAVILAGGSGTRFWPLSRMRKPKQLISVFGGKSMLQRTVERVLPLGPERILVVTNALQAEETARQLKEYQGQWRIDILEEPVGRNTGPAIGLAAMVIARHDPDGVMLVLPADHFIGQEPAFRDCVRKGISAAGTGALVTMGVVPTRPETGYGYIETAEESGEGILRVRQFVEKPDPARALQFLEAGNFYWNSGMFIWRADAILDSMVRFMPAQAAALSRLVFNGGMWDVADLQPQIDAIYPEIEPESIDFGVMEKSDNVLLIPASFPWSDVGSWSALPDLVEPDRSGNTVIGETTVVSVDSKGCLVCAEGKTAALVGMTDVIVVETPDALLLCRRERAQEVKKVVEELEKRGLKGLL